MTVENRETCSQLGRDWFIQGDWANNFEKSLMVLTIRVGPVSPLSNKPNFIQVGRKMNILSNNELVSTFIWD